MPGQTQWRRPLLLHHPPHASIAPWSCPWRPSAGSVSCGPRPAAPLQTGALRLLLGREQCRTRPQRVGRQAASTPCAPSPRARSATTPEKPCTCGQEQRPARVVSKPSTCMHTRACTQMPSCHAAGLAGTSGSARATAPIQVHPCDSRALACLPTRAWSITQDLISQGGGRALSASGCSHALLVDGPHAGVPTQEACTLCWLHTCKRLRSGS